jgi:flagellar secretion chaperone FliS
MKKNQAQLTYLRAAVRNATSVGLVVILYDLLVGDLERAVAAIAKGDIEKRSAELRHAFLVLQQLEGSLQKETGGEAAQNLANFYSALRCKILEAQIKVNPETLKRQIELILSVRKAWEQVDPATAPASMSAPNEAQRPKAAAAAAGAGAETTTANWTA